MPRLSDPYSDSWIYLAASIFHSRHCTAIETGTAAVSTISPPKVEEAMLTPHCKTALATVLCAAAFSQPGLAQVAPFTILQIDTENQVQYLEDVSDVSKYATDPSLTAACFPSTDPRVECAGRHMTFHAFIVIADVVAVNGQAVKGTAVIHGRRIQATPTPNDGQAIADVQRMTIQLMDVQILSLDGRPIGSIILSGLGIAPAAPGAPVPVVQTDYGIVGGTGAFLAAKGQAGGSGIQDSPVRLASIEEDPAYRRKNGGGKTTLVAQLIPMTRPGIVTTYFSPVDGVRPAKLGEVLIVKATGLGPTVSGVDAGQPFPSDVLQQVNSPVEVTMNGRAAKVVNSIGWPGLVDTYRVDFQVPDGTAPGMTAIQLSAAWFKGSPVSIPIQ
jgi:hypothetical protein